MGARVFAATLGQDVRLALAQAGGTLMPLMFFLVVLALFPLGLGSDSALLARVAPAVAWVASLLAALLALDRLFGADFEDGTLDQLVTAGAPVALVALAKTVAHWLVTALPLVVASPIAGILFQLDGDAIARLALSLALGTPALSAIGTLGAALTVMVRRGGVLVPILVLPLLVPVLIFGVGAAAGGAQAMQAFYFVGALSMGALVVGPVATAAALRLAVA
ncbi:heme exporter protein CcmB [Rhodothalassium salexigens]|uniref:heme exporter protein CcmB n=1 Tax=Rhodothalassium salexigens TaxID=1086 RepID=UPI001912EEEC|nr:heme exporter protein CcmB [Rhodothalassium salexigens]MBK5910462.1 heme exporter protein CcmB [Rhodothalassium salexigens]MBK5921720.1 heme exporter protein CcmB [Rhodothalassium salexigens]